MWGFSVSFVVNLNMLLNKHPTCPWYQNHCCPRDVAESTKQLPYTLCKSNGITSDLKPCITAKKSYLFTQYDNIRCAQKWFCVWLGQIIYKSLLILSQLFSLWQTMYRLFKKSHHLCFKHTLARCFPVTAKLTKFFRQSELKLVK